MTLPENYMSYPFRGARMDHHRYNYSRLFDRPPILWPHRARVALWITVHFEFYPLNMEVGPVKPIGAVDSIYPDYRNYTSRDYGNRVGAYRIMKVLERNGVKATAMFNSEVAERYPRLLEDVVKRGWEVAASGTDMGCVIHGQTPLEHEMEVVRRSIETLRRLSGQKVLGWHSPAHSESDATIDIVAEQGIEYVADWVNDDMPYELRSRTGQILSMPLTDEWADRNIIYQQRMPTAEFERQAFDAFQALYAEAATRGGRILSLPIHPWVMGQPHRIATLDRLLDRIMKHDGVWPATGCEILKAFKQQRQSSD